MGGFGGHRTANDRRRSAWGRPCIHPVARHGGRTGARQAHRDPGELKPGKPRGWRHPLHARLGDRAWTNVRSDRASRLRLFRAAREFRTGTEILDVPLPGRQTTAGRVGTRTGQRKLATYTSRRAPARPVLLSSGGELQHHGRRRPVRMNDHVPRESPVTAEQAAPRNFISPSARLTHGLDTHTGCQRLSYPCRIPHPSS